MKPIKFWGDVRGGLVRVNCGDAWVDCVMTGAAYRQWVCSLSTGDFHTHKVERVSRADGRAEGVVTVKSLRRFESTGEWD